MNDTNLSIQLYFLLGATALKHKNAPKLEIHNYVYRELDGLCRNVPHLMGHAAMLTAFRQTTLQMPHNTLTEEVDYLEAQFDTIKSSSGKKRLGQDPGNIDLTILAFATYHGCGIATNEHSLLELARAVHDQKKVFTLYGIAIQYIELDIISVDEVFANYNKFPKEESFRSDDEVNFKALFASLPAEQ